MYIELSLQELFSLAMLSITCAAQTETLERLTRKSTKSVDNLLNDRHLQKHIGSWERQWGPVIYSHSDKARVTADNAMLIVQKKNPEPEGSEVFVVSIMGTNPISLYGWIDEDFDVQRLVNWSHVLDPDKDDDSKGAISRGTYTGLNIQTTMMQDHSQTLQQFFAGRITDPRKQYHIYVTGHSLGGPMAVTMALYLHDTRSVWDNGCEAVIHLYPFAGATAGNAAFARYATSRINNTFHFPHRYWNHYDVVPHAWYEPSLARIPELYSDQEPPTLIINALVAAARLRAAGKEYIHIHEEDAALKAPPKSRKEKFLEAAVNGMLEEFMKIQDTLIPGKGELEKTLNFLIRMAWEHTIAYFELLNMLDILGIMLEDLIFSQTLASLLSGTAVHLAETFINKEISREKLDMQKLTATMHKLLQGHLK